MRQCPAYRLPTTYEYERNGVSSLFMLFAPLERQIGVLYWQCLDSRIPDGESLRREVRIVGD